MIKKISKEESFEKLEIKTTSTTATNLVKAGGLTFSDNVTGTDPRFQLLSSEEGVFQVKKNNYVNSNYMPC